MISANVPQYTVIAEKTLFDILREIWRAKFMMAGFALIAAIIAFIFISLANNFYRAEMVIAPANHMGIGKLSSSNSQDIDSGYVPSGVELQNNMAFIRFENIFNGTSVASFLVQDKKFMSGLNFDRMFEFSKARDNWDAQSLSEYLKKRVNIEPVSGTFLRRLTYSHPDKKFAADMIERIHRITDEMIRAHILVETNQRIEYLNNALVKIRNPEHRRSLAALLMEQERLKMMVSLDQPYAATIIEPAYVLSRACWPDPYIFYPIFIFSGLFLGYIVFGIMHQKKSA